MDALGRLRHVEGAVHAAEHAETSTSTFMIFSAYRATHRSERQHEGALHVGAAVASGGASIPGSAARMAGLGMKNRLALGIGKRAASRAEAMAPTLFNTDPAAAMAQMDAYAAQQQAWEGLVRRTAPKRAFGMFGRGRGKSGGRRAA